MKKINWLTIFVLFISLLVTNLAYAVCPLCTIVVGAGLGIGRFIGLDDTIIGIWIGGFILSGALWLIHYLKNKNINSLVLTLFIVILFYVITILPFYWTGLFGSYWNRLWGVDKLLLGILIGSVFYFLGFFVDIFLRAQNDCKVFFYFQKVILPVSSLLIASFIFYFITR